MSSMKIQCPPQTYSRLFRPWDMAQRNAAAAANNSQSINAHKAHAVEERATAAMLNKPAVPENLIKKTDKDSRRTTTTTSTIKVEIVKVERHNGMDVENEDEEVDVDDDGHDYDDDADDCDYLHTSRNSDCASSQSNFSQLSDETERQQYVERGRASAESGANNYQMHPSAHSNSYIAQQAHQSALSAHQHLPTRAAFEAYQQHHLHLLSHNLMSTPPAVATVSAATTPPLSTHLSSGFIYGSAAAAALSRTGEVVPTAPHPASLMGISTTTPAASFVGMEAYTFGLMEQEYARIMAEEAHLKAVNARKQRPKKFKCSHCDVAFSNNGQLKGHIRIHTGERPFKCDVETCGKTFTRNEELTRHKRIHTGLRPYPCPACGKKFGRRDHLKKHMKTHMPQERQLGPAIFVPMYPYLYGY